MVPIPQSADTITCGSSIIINVLDLVHVSHNFAKESTMHCMDLPSPRDLARLQGYVHSSTRPHLLSQP